MLMRFATGGAFMTKSRRAFLAQALASVCLSFSPARACAVFGAPAELAAALAQAGWDQRSAEAVAEVNGPWLCVLAGPRPREAQAWTHLVADLGRRPGLRETMRQHPGSAPLWARFLEPERLARDFGAAFGGAGDLQRRALAFVGRAGSARAAAFRISGLKRLGALTRDLMARGREDVLSLLVQDHAPDRRQQAIQDWFLEQTRRFRDDDAALDLMVWLARLHGPAMRRAASQGRGREAAAILRHLDPLSLRHVMADSPAEAAPLADDQARRLWALTNAHLWRFAERADGLPLLTRWGGLAVACLYGDGEGPGFAEATQAAQARVARDLLDRSDEFGQALFLLRNHADFQNLVGKNLASSTLNWILSQTLSADGAIDHDLLRDHAQRDRIALDRMAQEQDATLFAIPVARSFARGYSSLVYGTPFTVSDAFSVLEDVSDLALAASTLGGSLAVKAASREVGEAILRRASTETIRRAAGRLAASRLAQERNLRALVENAGEKLGRLTLDRVLAGFSGARAAKRGLSALIEGRKPESAPSRQVIEDWSGSPLDRLGLTLISATEAERRLQGSGWPAQDVERLRDLLDQSYATAETHLRRAADPEASPEERRAAREEAERSWMAYFALVWGVLRDA